MSIPLLCQVDTVNRTGLKIYRCIMTFFPLMKFSCSSESKYNIPIFILHHIQAINAMPLAHARKIY